MNRPVGRRGPRLSSVLWLTLFVVWAATAVLALMHRLPQG